jgi:hypothetical protein
MAILLRTEMCFLLLYPFQIGIKCKPVKYPYCVSCVSVCGRGVKHLSLSTIEPVYGFSRKLMGTLCYWIPLLLHTFQSLPEKITIWRTHEYMSG